VAAQLRRVHRSVAGAAPTQGHIVAVYGLRGGSGVTSLAVNLAATLHSLWGGRTVLVDYALPIGVCDTMLNLRPKLRLEALVTKPLDELDLDMVGAHLTQHPSGLHLLAGFEDPVQAEQLTDRLAAYLLDQVRQDHPYVVVDTSHDLTPPTVTALDQADVIVVPLTPDLNAVRLARAALELFEALGYHKDIIPVLNNTFVKNALSRAQIEKALGRALDVNVPYGEGQWANAINVGIPVVQQANPDASLRTALEDLAWAVSEPVQRQSKPANPSPAWQRAAARAQARKK
jgi:pilus assembly protein CpaE